MASEKWLIFLKRGYGGCSECGYQGDFDALTRSHLIDHSLMHPVGGRLGRISVYEMTSNSEREVIRWRCANCYAELSPGAGIDRQVPGAAREIIRLRLMQGDEYTTWPLALVHADNPLKIEQLQNRTGMIQAEAVDYLIETFGVFDLPEWIGQRGTSTERLEALRALVERYYRE